MFTQIISGDIHEVLPTLPQADLLLADPPFDEWEQFISLIAQHEHRTLACFTSWQHRIPIERALGKPQAEIIWHFRDGRWVSHNLPRITHSSILVYGETHNAFVGEPNTNLAPQPKGKGSVGRDKLEERTYYPRERKMLNSVIIAPRVTSNGLWTKPSAVLRPLIEWLCPEGGLVIDAFVGGGASLEVARDLGRNIIGVDIDPDVCERLANRTQPMF